jgi:dephospho-CoA kinase
MTKIIGVTGMPLSGKTTVAEILEDKMDYAVLDMGEVVRIEMKDRDIPVEKTGEFVNKMRETHGMDAIAQISTPYLEEILEAKNKIVITGMRSWDEKNRFEEETNTEIDILAIWTPRETRKERRENRQREEDQVGDEFHERDLREIENGVGKLTALSDHLIKNNNITEQELQQKVKQICQ